MAVEKLLSVKFAKIKLRQDALDTIFSIFLDIFYPPNFRCFEENGLFQHPQAFTPTIGLLVKWRYHANHGLLHLSVGETLAYIIPRTKWGKA